MAHHISPLQETARAFFVPMALRHACCRPSRMLAPRSFLAPFRPFSCFDLLQKVRSRSPAAQDPHLAVSPAPQVLTFGACFPLPFSRCGRHSFLPCRRGVLPLVPLRPCPGSMRMPLPRHTAILRPNKQASCIAGAPRVPPGTGPSPPLPCP